MVKKIILLIIVVISFLAVNTTRTFAATGCLQYSLDPRDANPGAVVTVHAKGCVPAGDNFQVDLLDSAGNLIQSYPLVNFPGTDQFNATMPATMTLTTGSYSTKLTNLTTGENIPVMGGFTVNNGTPVVYPDGSKTEIVNAVNGLCGVNYISTAIGCVPIGDQNALIGFFLRWGLGIGGGIAILLIIVAGFQIMSSRGDPNRLKAGQELMTSAIAGLLLLIFSLVILRIIGYDILDIPAFK